MGGASPIEGEAQAYRQQFGAAIPRYLQQGQGYMSQGIQGLNQNNTNISNYISGIGRDPANQSLQSYLSSVMSGGIGAAQGSASSASAQQATATNLGMQGQMFAQQFGSDLGGLALQQKNMQTVADQLGSTTNNPFAVLNSKAVEDAALQNNAGMAQLQSQLGSQGLDPTSGTGAAALAALQFNTNKSVMDAYRQDAVQGAQFQQQGLGMAGSIYNQLAGLDLQRATTRGQLGLQGYQQDIANAGRQDAVSMQNAQLGTQASIANAQNGTQASLQNAAMQNQWLQAALSGQLQMNQGNQQLGLQALGMQGQNFNTIAGFGNNLFNSAYGAQQGYMGNLNQMAQGAAQGRGALQGGLIQGGLGLLGTVLGGPIGGGIGTAIGSVFTPRR